MDGTPNPGNLRCVQINLDNSEVVTTELSARRRLATDKVYVALVAVHLPERDSPHSLEQDEFSPRALAIPHRVNNYFSVCELQIQTQHAARRTRSIYLVSAYFKYNSRIEIMLEQLHLILSTLRGEEVIMCVDVNAKSALWFNIG